jgi:alkanesulfonate monooxygenase SsuD/methylene tetrahydromethanopterin reductase-like flavin-dependent oxidoreductase (luciferase family)
VKFGVFDHLDRATRDLGEQYEGRLRLAEAYDEAGFHAYHLAEHHMTPLGLAPSPSVFLAAVAQRTRSLRLGPLVYTLSLYHPLRLAEEICMLDQLSGGRLELGVGRGISPIELGYYGIETETARPRFLETLEIVLQALQTDRLSFEGLHHAFHDVPIELEPVQRPHPPLWYGVERVDTVEWVVPRAMNAVCSAPAPEVRTITDAYRRLWRETNGPEATQPLLGMSRHIVIDDNDHDARRSAGRAYTAWYGSLVHLWQAHGMEIPLKIPPDFDDAVASGYCLAGSPATVRARLIEQTREAGVNYVLGRFAFGDLSAEESLQTVSLFRTEVMTAFDDAVIPGPPAPVGRETLR